MKSKKKKIRCYLAGKFGNYKTYVDWRDFIKKRLENKIDFYDPRTDTKQGSIATFVYQDLAGVESCDLIFYFITNSGDIGAAIECERADSKNGFIVLCINDGVKIVHPFLVGISRRVFVGLETGAIYLKNLAKCGLANEFEAIYKTMEQLN